MTSVTKIESVNRNLIGKEQKYFNWLQNRFCSGTFLQILKGVKI